MEKTMNVKQKTVSLILSTLLLSTPATLFAAETLRIDCGVMPCKNIFEPIKEPFAKATGITIESKTATPAQGWKDLTEGKADAAIYGLSFNEVIVNITHQGGNTNNSQDMFPQIITTLEEGTKVITNKNIDIKSLPPSSLRDIFAGTTKNWSELGGPNMPIIVVIGTKIPGVMEQFQKTIMQGQEYTASAKTAPRYEDIKEIVVKTPGAIGFSSAAVLDNSVNSVRYSGGMRVITMVTKGPASPKLQQMVQFIQKEGKKYIIQ